MAAKHILSLEVLNVSNPEVFSIKDTSKYAKNLKVDCPEVLITPPGFNKPALIKVQEGFDLVLESCSLGIQTTDCNTQRTVIPDGLYIIRYQVSPHNKVFVEYNYLRITNIMKTWYDKLCKLDIQACEPSRDRQALLDEMMDIKLYIDAAKAKVEYCASPEAGLELYTYAKSKLNKITCSNC